MSLISDVISNMRLGNSLSLAVKDAVSSLKQDKSEEYITHLKIAYEKVDDDPPPLTKEELKAFEARMDTYSQKLDNFNRLSEEVQDTFIAAAYDSIHLKEGGALQYANVFKQMQGYIEASRTVGQTALDAFEQFRKEVLNKMETADLTAQPEGITLLHRVDDVEKMVKEQAVSMAWQSYKNSSYSANRKPLDKEDTGTKKIVHEMMGVEEGISGKITAGMQYLYNLRRSYEIFAQMKHQGADHEQLKTVLKGSICSSNGSEPADALDTRLRYFNEEFEAHNGSPELSLRFMAERMDEFNHMIENSTVGKVMNEMDINPNRNFIGADFSSNIDIILEAVGADAFQSMIGLFHKDKDLEKALMQIEQHNRIMFAETCIIDSKKQIRDAVTGQLKNKYYFSTKALFDNGLPSGIELRFEIGEDSKVFLSEVDFHGQKLDRNTFLKTEEIQHIIAQLPPEMRAQMEKSLVVRLENGVYRPGIVSNPMSKEAMDLYAQQTLESLKESNFKMTFGSSDDQKPFDLDEKEEDPYELQ